MNSKLMEIANRINWYTAPDRVLENVNLFLCQVMARGDADDLIAVQQHYSREDFQSAYLHAPPGLFTKRAWVYWGVALFDTPDYPMPERFPGSNQFDWKKLENK